MTPAVCAFRHELHGAYTYVVVDPDTRACAIVDPVLDEPGEADTETRASEALVRWVGAADLKVLWILDTHIHADHLSAAAVLRHSLGGRTAIGAGLRDLIGALLAAGRRNLSGGSAGDSPYDVLLEDGAELRIGRLVGRVLHTPGHTPSCTTYLIGDAAFVGDALLMPDAGTGRCDFPGGNARTLYQSAQRLFALPATTRVYVGHDYGCGGARLPAHETTIAQQRAHNIHLGQGRPLEQFVAMREARDALLAPPALMEHAVRFNLASALTHPGAQSIALSAGSS